MRLVEYQLVGDDAPKVLVAIVALGVLVQIWVMACKPELNRTVRVPGRSKNRTMQWLARISGCIAALAVVVVIVQRSQEPSTLGWLYGLAAVGFVAQDVSLWMEAEGAR